MDSVLVTYLKYGDWEISVIVDQSQGKDRSELLEVPSSWGSWWFMLEDDFFWGFLIYQELLSL